MNEQSPALWRLPNGEFVFNDEGLSTFSADVYVFRVLGVSPFDMYFKWHKKGQRLRLVFIHDTTPDIVIEIPDTFEEAVAWLRMTAKLVRSKTPARGY